MLEESGRAAVVRLLRNQSEINQNKRQMMEFVRINQKD